MQKKFGKLAEKINWQWSTRALQQEKGKNTFFFPVGWQMCIIGIIILEAQSVEISSFLKHYLDEVWLSARLDTRA